MRIKSSRRLHWFVTICLSSAATTCVASAPNILESGDLQKALSSETVSVVAGQIRWFEHGAEKEIGKGLLSFSISPMLLRMEDRSRTLAEVDQDGSFMWALDPGIYVINRINYRDPWSGNYFVVPKVAFHVPDRGKIYYIGTMRADFAAERDIIGGLSGDVAVVIEDEARGSYDDVAPRFGVEPGDVEASLMVHVEGLPRTIDTTQEFQIAVQILNAVLLGLSY
jgi:hypothetical protein